MTSPCIEYSLNVSDGRERKVVPLTSSYPGRGLYIYIVFSQSSIFPSFMLDTAAVLSSVAIGRKPVLQKHKFHL